ncbi:hypothetical protein BGZ46_001369 [Entomortierella lignicola]|nr:hypothetical protein BGZ46_001369 [Entomortierella lignicola]
MSIVLPQTPISLQNPYSVLEPEYEQSITTIADNIAQYNISSNAMLIRTISNDDLDGVSISSWSMVNSAFASDDEDEDEGSDEEIYVDASGNQLSPLTVSTLSEGFTNISKTMTATSINSTSAATVQPDVWVVKISKKQQQSSKPRPRSHIATAPSLEDVIEEGLETVYNDEDIFMSMSEHELSKSCRAVNLKNIRLATAHTIALRESSNVSSCTVCCPKLPKSSASKDKDKVEKIRGRSIDPEKY